MPHAPRRVFHRMVLRIRGISLLLTIAVIFSCWTSYSGVSGRPEESKCSMTDDIPKLQHLCKGPNDAMLEAESKQNYKKTCKQLILTLKCVADNVTWCYFELHEMYSTYFASPTYCKIGVKHVKAIQKILNSKTAPVPPPITTSIATTQPPPPQTSEGEDSITTLESNNSSQHSVTTTTSNQEKGDEGGVNTSGGTKRVRGGVTDRGYTIAGGGGKGSKGGVGSEGTSEKHKGTHSKGGNNSSKLTVHTLLVTIATVIPAILATT